ncbi:patatin-like phospholipase family protein [Pandoraea bronchicola]|uniref:Alpha/beta hydrolase n=1 Tax=Pandoraea bronchicola TaxID=2508287 RepID=A0A5E5BT10_9BURK|nr:patatin-like phospholipase family protein [Pandoraea bronchicola]VVE88538.1 alpha/beta hydrolase [Pandoraea bronchicola]
MSRLPPESADNAAGDTSSATPADGQAAFQPSLTGDATGTPTNAVNGTSTDLEPTDVPLLPPDGLTRPARTGKVPGKAATPRARKPPPDTERKADGDEAIAAKGSADTSDGIGLRAPAKSAKSSRNRRDAPRRKGIDLGLQGGGAHGAYTWGVLDKLLEDGRLEFEGISGASAGTMNAVVLAHGLLDRPGVDPREKARESLHSFWLGVSQAGSSATAWAQTVFSWLNGRPTEYPVWHDWMQSMQQWMMPFSQPPAEINPLRTVLEAQVDFERLRESTTTHLFVSATNIRTGNIRIFRTHEITLDVAMASACLPWLFKPVKIDEDFYWDGGYLGNPALYPFYYETVTSDILIVHINPIERKEKPVLPGQIMNRVNEITFNASLQREFRAISFVHKLLDEGWLKPEFRKRLKYPLIHSIRADKELYDLSSSTKFVTDWNFLTTLRDRGREAASRWLDAHFADVGVRSTVDLRRDYLQRLPDATAIKA